MVHMRSKIIILSNFDPWMQAVDQKLINFIGVAERTVEGTGQLTSR